MKLLIVEDELDLRTALLKGFQKLQYTVDCACDGQEALELLYENTYDLMILDVNMPHVDGFQVLRQLREHDQQLKVIILSARSDIADRIHGLDSGANDYVLKPFHFKELDARVRSLLRRRFIQQENTLECRSILLNLSMRTLSVNGHKIDLTAREYGIVEYLMLHQAQIVSAEELMEHVWASDYDMFSNAIKVHISSLRKKIAQFDSFEYIRNVRGSGYMMNQEEES